MRFGDPQRAHEEVHPQRMYVQKRGEFGGSCGLCWAFQGFEMAFSRRHVQEEILTLRCPRCRQAVRCCGDPWELEEQPSILYTIVT